MHKKTGYRATWNPGLPLKIGFIGKLDTAGSFTVFSSLEREGIIAEVLSDDSKSEMDYTSSDKVSVNAKLSGTVPAAGSVLSNLDAGFDISFNSEKAIIFKASGVVTDQITNIGAIEKQILGKYADGSWDKELLVITQLVRTDAATIIISTSSSGKLELKANAGIGAGTGLKITDASLDLSVASEKGSSIKFISENGLTPLYRVMGVRDPLIGRNTIVVRGTEAEQEDSFIIRDFKEAELEEIELQNI
jgi:hypothetical protein